MGQENSIVDDSHLLLEKLDGIAKRAKERSKKDILKNEFNKNVIKLPDCKDSERTIPNIIARSALFGIIKRGVRPYKNKELIASRNDIKIYYTGKTLDQADCTVWMQALACTTVLGQDISVNRAKFLKLLGKSSGKKDYVWLDSSLHRLMTGVVTVITPKYQLEFHLIDTWGKFRDENQPTEYLLNINPKVIKMWANSEYTKVRWNKRLAIRRGSDLASWMQLYIRTNINNDKPHYISLDKLKVWCGLSNMRLRQYRLAMLKALNELTRIGEIKDAKINTDNVAIFTRISDRDSNTLWLKQDRDSSAFDRDSNAPDDRDSNAPDDRDSNAPDDRDSNAPDDRDSNAPDDRDSNAKDRDSNAKDRDSNAKDRDSNARHQKKNSIINSLWRFFFS